MNLFSHDDLHHMHLLHWNARPRRSCGLAVARHVGQKGPSSPRTHNDTLTLICRCSALTHADDITAASEQREEEEELTLQHIPHNCCDAPLMKRCSETLRTTTEYIITPAHFSRELRNSLKHPTRNQNISEHVPPKIIFHQIGVLSGCQP